MNKYKSTREREFPESSYISWKNPKRSGEFQKESYKDAEQEQEHFEVLHYLKDRDYNLRMLLGDTMVGVSQFEKNGSSSELLSLVEEITGEKYIPMKSVEEMSDNVSEENVAGEFELQCNYCDKTFSSDDYDDLTSAKKAKGGHHGSAHPGESKRYK